MGLDPQAKVFIDAVAGMGLPPFHTLTTDQGRVAIAGLGQFMGVAEEVESVAERSVPVPGGTIPIRLLRPADAEGTAPAVLFFHGGGWSTGSIDVVDPLCRQLANRSGCVVIAVGYRLAPEHPYPTGAEDAYAALCWVAENAGELGVDPARLAVAGDSAGGNLSAVVCLMSRDRSGPPVRLQVLVYPSTDVNMESASHRDNGQGYILTREMMSWFIGRAFRGCPPEARLEPYASPLWASDHGGLPPAVIATAEYDPIRDEGAAYAEVLEKAGVPVEYRCWEGQIHGFLWMGAVMDAGRALLDEIADRLRHALAP